MNTIETSSVKSANRVLDVLEFMASRNAPVSHTELARFLAIPKSSLTQLLRNLVLRNYLQVDRDSNGYLIGDALFETARQGQRQFELADIARPVLQKLAGEMNESCSLTVRKGSIVQMVVGANSNQTLRYVMQEGDTAPLYAVSSGKAILTYLPEKERQEYLETVRLKPITPATITRVEDLVEQLEKVAVEAVGYSFEEYTPGIIGMGVPILDVNKYPIGAINFAIPTPRYNETSRVRLLGALQRSAGLIESKL